MEPESPLLTGSSSFEAGGSAGEVGWCGDSET
jgi:hypothetical protein